MTKKCKMNCLMYFLLTFIGLVCFTKYGYSKQWPNQCGVRKHFRAKRVIGGNEAPINSWPWLVNLISSEDSRQYCSGSIIDRYWILTAAHCFIYYNDNGSTVIHSTVSDYSYHVADHSYNVTDPDEYTVEASHLFVHPRFKEGDKNQPGDYDTALIKLKRPLTFNDRVRPICLPHENSEFPIGYSCYLTGWGNTVADSDYHRSPVLKEAKLPLVSFAECNSAQSYNGIIPNRFLCAGFPQGGIDGCYGDSGAPLQCELNGLWTIVGTMSWGKGCAEPHHYGVYSNVTHLLSFVKAILKGPNKEMRAYYQRRIPRKLLVPKTILYQLLTKQGRFSDVDLVRNLQLVPRNIKLLKHVTLEDLAFVTDSPIKQLYCLEKIWTLFVQQSSRLDNYKKSKKVASELHINFDQLLVLTKLSKQELLNPKNNITEVLNKTTIVYRAQIHHAPRKTTEA